MGCCFSGFSDNRETSINCHQVVFHVSTDSIYFVNLRSSSEDGDFVFSSESSLGRYADERNIIFSPHPCRRNEGEVSEASDNNSNREYLPVCFPTGHKSAPIQIPYGNGFIAYERKGFHKSCSAESSLSRPQFKSDEELFYLSLPDLPTSPGQPHVEGLSIGNSYTQQSTSFEGKYFCEVQTKGEYLAVTPAGLLNNPTAEFKRLFFGFTKKPALFRANIVCRSLPSPSLMLAEDWGVRCCKSDWQENTILAYAEIQ